MAGTEITNVDQKTVESESDYWAALPTEDIGSEVKERIDNYYTFIRSFGRLITWKRTYNQYYTNVRKGAMLIRDGASGEYVLLNVNHFHNILSHLKTLTISQRPEFEPQSTNTDYESQSQCILANGLLDYYMRTKGLETYISTAVEHALIFGEGFIRAEWDATEGKVYGTTETGAPIHEGDVKYANFTPIDVARDYSKESPHDQDWLAVRTFKNRYTMAAKFPKSKDLIMSAPDKSEIMKDLTFTNPMLYGDTDDIVVYEFYHRPTAALPKGRVVWILETADVIQDGPLPYREIPVYRIAAEEQATTPFGFTVAFDLLPIQENVDNMVGTITTNQNAFGVQNIIMEQGAGVSEQELYGALNLIKVPKGTTLIPQAMKLLATPPEVFSFLTTMIEWMETLSGVNSVARGNPQASLKSGAALAMVQSMAIQFNMPLQLSYTRLVERLGVATLNLLKDYANTPRVATIVGKANRSLMKEFSKKDIEHVDRVIVNLGNPLTQTTAGRINLAETLLQNKLITDADQYLMVLTTGQLQPIIEGKQSELLLIRSENESLQDGKPVKALVTDNHAQHINEHKVILASPEARMNPQLVQNALAHLQDHINFLKDPQYQELLQLLNEAGVQQGQPQAGPQQGQPNPVGAPPGNAGPPGTAGKPIQPPTGLRPIVGAGPAQAALPSGPTNPLTHVKTVLPVGAGRNTPTSGTVRPH